MNIFKENKHTFLVRAYFICY